MRWGTMNKKLQNIVLMIFLAICSGIATSDTIFPIITGTLKFILLLFIPFFLWIAFTYVSRYINAYNRLKKETIYKLLFQSGIRSFIVNALTIYRIIVTPILFIYMFHPGHPIKLFLLASAFISDALDGFLARRFKVTSKLGATLDSFADDMLFILALTSFILLHPEVITQHVFILSILIILFIFKMIILWFKHDKLISGMHTYLTKFSAIFQAIFFIQAAFFSPNEILFYIVVITTMLALIEENIIIFFFRELKTNAKGLFFHRSQM